MRKLASHTLNGPERVIYINFHFIFHAFDFIIRTKFGFTKSRDTCCNAGSSALCLATTQFRCKNGDAILSLCPCLRNRCRNILQRKSKHSVE